MIAIANQLVNGVLLGGLYAMYAVGLSLAVGVLRFVNIAHGDLIVLGSFFLLTITTALGISPFLAVLLMLPIAFGAGYALQRLLLQRIVGKGILLVVLVTFGLSVIIQNGLLETYGPDTRKISAGALETATIRLLPGVNIGLLPLLTFAAAVAMIALVDRLLHASRIGAKIRAVADDPAAADLIGLATAPINAIAMGVIGVTIAVASCFTAIWSNFEPSSGSSNLLVAFESVVLGGLGSLWGTLAGGILLALAQTIGAQVDSAWQVLAGHLFFLSVLLVRPQGLFPRG